MYFNLILPHLLYLFGLLIHCFSFAPNNCSSVELYCFLELNVCFFHRFFSSLYQSHFPLSLSSVLRFLWAAKCSFSRERGGSLMKKKKKERMGWCSFRKGGQENTRRKGGREVRRTACLVTALCRWICQVAHWIAATHTDAQTTREQNSDKAAYRKYYYYF